MTLPDDAQARKSIPLHAGFFRYFPSAIVAVAALSAKGNIQHCNGDDLHWDRSKSSDEGDALLRHQLQVGTVDTDGVRHAAKVAWRALAQLQKELEADGAPIAPGATNAPRFERGAVIPVTAEEMDRIHAGAQLDVVLAERIRLSQSDDPNVGSLKAGEAHNHEHDPVAYAQVTAEQRPEGS